MQGIASQILSESQSEPAAQVTPPQESSEQTTETAAPKELNDFDSRFGVLTKMERKIKEQEAQFKNRSKEWEDKDLKLKEHEEFMALFEENPLEALKKKKGWGIQEFNEFAVKHGTDEDLDPVSKITKSYEEKIAELEKKFNSTMEERIQKEKDEIAKKEHEFQIKEFKSGIKSFLAENKEAYEFINAEENGAESVYELIYEDILRQQAANVPEDQLKIMDTKEAAEKVEAFLDKTYSKYLSLNKVKSKFGNSDENAALKLFKQSEPQTLNSSFSPKSKPVSQLSPEERKQQAIDFIKSQKT